MVWHIVFNAIPLSPRCGTIWPWNPWSPGESIACACEDRMLNLQAPRKPAIVVAATFTADPLLPALQLILDGAGAGLDLDVRLAPYHQVFQELLSSISLLATNVGGVDVILLRVEDFIREIADIEEAR